MSPKVAFHHAIDGFSLGTPGVGLPFCDPFSFFRIMRRYLDVGGLPSRPWAPVLISERTFNSVRATRWFLV